VAYIVPRASDFAALKNIAAETASFKCRAGLSRSIPCPDGARKSTETSVASGRRLVRSPTLFSIKLTDRKFRSCARRVEARPAIIRLESHGSKSHLAIRASMPIRKEHGVWVYNIGQTAIPDSNSLRMRRRTSSSILEYLDSLAFAISQSCTSSRAAT